MMSCHFCRRHHWWISQYFQTPVSIKCWSFWCDKYDPSIPVIITICNNGRSNVPNLEKTSISSEMWSLFVSPPPSLSVLSIRNKTERFFVYISSQYERPTKINAMHLSFTKLCNRGYYHHRQCGLPYHFCCYCLMVNNLQQYLGYGNYLTCTYQLNQCYYHRFFWPTRRPCCSDVAQSIARNIWNACGDVHSLRWVRHAKNTQKFADEQSHQLDQLYQTHCQDYSLGRATHTGCLIRLTGSASE